MISKSKINFNTVNETKIVGFLEMEFGSERLSKLECAFADCELSAVDLSYMLNLNDEWVRGSASCSKKSCLLSDLNHVVQTSNTDNIFTILNQARILNPLTTMYLFGAINSGQKINDGHELKLQF